MVNKSGKKIQTNGPDLKIHQLFVQIITILKTFDNYVLFLSKYDSNVLTKS